MKRAMLIAVIAILGVVFLAPHGVSDEKKPPEKKPPRKERWCVICYDEYNDERDCKRTIFRNAYTAEDALKYCRIRNLEGIARKDYASCGLWRKNNCTNGRDDT